MQGRDSGQCWEPEARWFLDFIDEITEDNYVPHSPAGALLENGPFRAGAYELIYSPHKDARGAAIGLNENELVASLLDAKIAKLLEASVTPTAVAKMLGFADCESLDIQAFRRNLISGDEEVILRVASFFEEYEKWTVFNQ